MPTPNPVVASAPKMRTETYKKLIRERCPQILETNEGQVFSSIIISLSERLDRAEADNDTLKKSVRAMAFMLREMVGDGEGAEGGEVADETVEGEEAGSTTTATGTVGGGGGGSASASATTGPTRKQDATPFPSGVPASKAEAEAQAAAAARAGAAPAGGPAAAAPAGSPNKTGPIDDGEDLTPNVQGGPAVNPQPIPNGRRPNA